MLRQLRKECFTYARQLGDYQAMTEEQLMNGYCEALDTGDAEKKNQYVSAMILRKWYTIHSKILPKGKLYGIEDEADAFAILTEALDYAAKYRAWQNPEKKCNAQAAVNQCIATICEQHRYQVCLDKHKANYNTKSLDAPVRGKNGDEETATVADTLEGYDIDTELNAGLGVVAMIQECIKRNRPVEAIFLDIMAFNDCLKHTSKTIKTVDLNGEKMRYAENYVEGWDYRTIQLTNEIDPATYLPYFTGKYAIPQEIAEVALDSIVKANNQKKYRYLRKTKEFSKQLALEFLLD